MQESAEEMLATVSGADMNEVARGNKKKGMYCLLLQPHAKNKTINVHSFTSLKRLYMWDGWDVKNTMTYNEFKKIAKGGWFDNNGNDYSAFANDKITLCVPYTSKIIYT